MLRRASLFILLLGFTLDSRAQTELAPDPQVAELIEAVRGRRVGLITNPTGVDVHFRPIADLLAADPDVRLAAFFAPEHGLRGDRQAGARVEDYTDEATGAPVYSIYGSRRAPTAEQLAALDVLVFDIQDVGARFYTYVWTMTHAMEAAAAAGVDFIVFDRPNPIGLTRVEGPPIRFDAGLIGRKWDRAPFGLPTRHGMTAGEIARLVNGEWIDPQVKLEVIAVPGLNRATPFEATGRPWVMPSPNMPTRETALVYPGAALFEGTNLSEGRGTTRPFELIGAPSIDGARWADELNALGLAGVRFRPAAFTPTFDDRAGERCGGVQIHVVDPEAFEPVRAALHMLQTVKRLHPEQVDIGRGVDRLIGLEGLRERIESESVEEIAASWRADLESFLEIRRKHLIYPESP